MGIRVFNTASGRKEEFKPLRPGRVGMYVCGVTVYDFSHLGHARGAYVFDIVRRYLEYRGFKVTYVRNFTDIDDKIIQRANETGVSSRELAERFIAEYRADMERLGVRPADVEPKATEHIPEIVAIVRRLEEKGLAYAVDGDVYYRVGRFPGYGKLSHRPMEDMLAGARVEVDERKENPMDFALWKSSKPGEPSWDSPWGKGRPGWHIECSAMSVKHLGETFDIHGGGKDLVFPHHENEIAQTEGATGAPFVSYWMHNGFVNVDKEKMSKSLGNFFTIRDILDKYDAEAVRLFLLSTHYRNPIDFSDKALTDTERSLTRFYLFAGEARKLASAGGPAPASPGGRELLAEVEAMEDAFRAAMDDDFNTAQALGEIFRVTALLGPAARGREDVPAPEAAFILGRYLAVMERLATVLGVFGGAPGDWAARQAARDRARLSGLDEGEIERLIAERNRCRAAREWKKADAIRDALLAKGIALKDGPGGTTWESAG